MKIERMNNIPCKYAYHYFDWVPYGSTNVQMPGFECEYEDDIEIPEDMTCYEDNRCPAYTPMETEICNKHNLEFIGVCWKCEQEQEMRYETMIQDKEKKYD